MQKPHPLKQWRLDNNMQAKTLAKNAAIDTGNLSLIENRKRAPTPMQAYALESITGIDAKTLFIEGGAI